MVSSSPLRSSARHDGTPAPMAKQGQKAKKSRMAKKESPSRGSASGCAPKKEHAELPSRAEGAQRIVKAC